MPRQRRQIGAILKVPIGDGWHSYAQVLDEPEVAFFDVRTRTDFAVFDILDLPCLFRLWVMNWAVTSGRWSRVGKADVAGPFRQPIARFREDAIDGSLWLHLNGVEEPAQPFECADLECAAV